MKSCWIVLMVLSASLTTGGEAQAGKHDRLQKQEQCERLCVSCMAAGAGEGSFCVQLSQFCCKRSGGHIYSTCGCRTEMITYE